MCARCGIPRPDEGWRRLPMRFQSHELRMQAGCGAHTPVYLARGSEGGSLVAFKLVPAGAPPALIQALKRRFARECNHAQVLSGYKEIVKGLEHGTAGGIPYLKMEGVQGSTLHQVMGKPAERDPLNPARTSPMPPQRAVRMLRRIVAAVGRLHQHKLIHRDIKPSNLFLSRSDQGVVKLADMGSAWLSSSADKPDSLVSSPEELSPASAPYMSPELVRGDRSLKPCSDIYSIGVLAHEMVTGRLPYQVTEAMAGGPAPGAPELSPKRWGMFRAGWLKAHLVAERLAIVEARPDLPAALGDFLAQCLARDPHDRMQSTGELIMQLALIEQELSRGAQSEVAVPAPAPVGAALLNGPPRPGAVSPVPVGARPPTGPQKPSEQGAAPVGSLSKVINLAQDRDRLTMELSQLRAALQQTQVDLTRTREELAAAQAENRRLKEHAAAPVEQEDPLRKTGRLPEADAPSSQAVPSVVPGPVASNPFMKTELEGDLAAELERAANAGAPYVEGDDARRPADVKGTGPALLQTRFQETIPGSPQLPHPSSAKAEEKPADMVDRLIRETSAGSASMARQLKRAPKKRAQPDGDDMDMMKTNVLEGPIDEVNTSEPTSVVSEDDLMSEMKTRAVERAVPPPRRPKKKK